MNITVFENKYVESFKGLADITKQKKELENTEKEIKARLLGEMTEHGIASIDNEYIKLTVVPPSESYAIDLKLLLAEDPDLYHELERKYNKRTTRKASLRVTVR